MDLPQTVKILKFNKKKCKYCLECEKACSNVHFKTDEDGDKSAIHILKKGKNYQMQVCNQCGLCIDMCPVGSLKRRKSGVVTLNKNSCIGCQACVGFCPSNNMSKSNARIEPFKCISCGACVRACPEEALEIIEENIDKINLVVYHKQGVQ